MKHHIFPFSMAQGIATAANVEMDTLSELVHPYAYTSLGIYNFLKKHNIKSPRVFVPATCHYSWPKAATVLGLGEDNLIHIKVDKMARQDMVREYCLLLTRKGPQVHVTAGGVRTKIRPIQKFRLTPLSLRQTLTISEFFPVLRFSSQNYAWCSCERNIHYIQGKKEEGKENEQRNDRNNYLNVL